MSQPPNQQLNNPQGTNQQNFYQQQQTNYPLQQQQYYPPQSQYGFQQNSTQHHQQQSPSQQQSYPPQTQLYQTQPNQQQQQIHQQPPQSQQQQQQLQLQQQQQQIQLQQQQNIQHQQQLQHQQQQQYQPQVQTQQQFNSQPQPTYPHQQFIQQQQQSQQLMQQQFQKMNKSNHQQASQAAQTQQQQQVQSQQQQQNNQQQQPQQQIHQGQQQKTIDPKVQLKNVYDKVPLQSLEESLFEICPQMGIMSLLQKYEQAIDQMAKKKRVELQESFIQPSNKIKQTMRILVYSEAENQSNDLQSDTTPTWKVTIKGKILEEFTQKGKPFSNYFKQVEIKLNKLQFPLQNEFQQTNKNNTESHGFELLRQGNQDTEIEILLYPQNYPQKYKVLLQAQNQLNKNLQQILGLREATRSQILASFWEYIKLNNLQDKDNREYIIADENLKQIFHQERLQMGHLNMQLKLLLENPDPIRILHTITMTDTPDSSIKGYDILIEGETQFQPELMPFLASKVVTDDNTEKKSQRQEHPFMILNQKVKSYEKQIQKLTEQLKSHKMKYDMFKSYTNNPSLFLENILIQQNSYLEMINSENSWKGENPKNLKFLLKNQDIVEKQIRKYLDQKEENPLQQSVM